MNRLDIAEAVCAKLKDNTSLQGLKGSLGLASDQDTTDALVRALAVVHELYALDCGVTLGLVTRLEDLEASADNSINIYRGSK